MSVCHYLLDRWQLQMNCGIHCASVNCFPVIVVILTFVPLMMAVHEACMGLPVMSYELLFR